VGEGGEWAESELASLPDPAGPELEAIWDREWQRRLVALAMERVKRRVRAEHYQIFELCSVQDWPMAKVAKALGVTMTLVYVTRHRVGAMLKKELRRLEEETG
jgi:RNA polymerase sigma-70 factor (ECF subfamily)